MADQRYVYESPDGGHTIYRRHPGKLDRELVSIDQETQDKLAALKEDKLWGDIRRRAQQDPALQQMLDQLRIYYSLKYAKD
jgi:hypothetical protein